MCLICVEYYFKRMTKDEVKNALPEMIMFAKNDDERNHFKKIQSMNSEKEMDEASEAYVSENANKVREKNEYKTSYKTRRP